MIIGYFEEKKTIKSSLWKYIKGMNLNPYGKSLYDFAVRGDDKAIVRIYLQSH